VTDRLEMSQQLMDTEERDRTEKIHASQQEHQTPSRNEWNFGRQLNLHPGGVNLLYDNERFIPAELGWIDIVDPYRSTHETPVGYDFTLSQIYKMYGYGTLWQDDKSLPRYTRIVPTSNMYHLDPGMYLVEFEELVKIPDNYMGLMWPRSSLLRCGVDMGTAVWDAGYQGVSKSSLIVHNTHGFNIEVGTRIGHMVMVPCALASSLYAGQYQNEGVE